MLRGGLQAVYYPFITCSIETNYFNSSSKVIRILVNLALIFFSPSTNFLAGIHLLGLQVFYWVSPILSFLNSSFIEI